MLNSIIPQALYVRLHNKRCYKASISISFIQSRWQVHDSSPSLLQQKNRNHIVEIAFPLVYYVGLVVVETMPPCCMSSQQNVGMSISLSSSKSYGEPFKSWSVETLSSSWLNFEVFLNIQVIIVQNKATFKYLYERSHEVLLDFFLQMLYTFLQSASNMYSLEPLIVQHKDLKGLLHFVKKSNTSTKNIYPTASRLKIEYPYVHNQLLRSQTSSGVLKSNHPRIVIKHH